MSVFLVIIAVSLFSINVLTVDGLSKEEACQQAAQACETARQSDLSGVPANIVSQLWQACTLAKQECENNSVSEEQDSDNDGILDTDDVCPNQPETINGHDDEDGCPDTLPPIVEDSDGDGILDSEDECPTERESINGYQDYDGCYDVRPPIDVIPDEQTEEQDQKTNDELVDEEQDQKTNEEQDEITHETIDARDLNYDDRVYTGDNEFKTINFDDGSIIELKPNSVFIMKEDADSKPVLTLTDGIMRIKHKIQKAVDFEMKKYFPYKYRTPNVPVSVRGTDFILSYDSSTDTTTINLFEGRIAVGPFLRFDSPDADNGQLIENMHYEIDGGKILDISPDIPQKSLLIDMETTSDGELTITLPRELIDSRLGQNGQTGEDDVFFVLVDGAETNYDEIATFDDERTLAIPFGYGTNQIEIVGTFVEPDYVKPDETIEFDAPQTIVADNFGIVSATPLSQATWESLTADSQSLNSQEFENSETKESTTTTPSEKSGCLIATAAYGTELAPQVQLLREVRDNVLFSTNSGTAFMAEFNDIYYSFSPTIADLERQSPPFKEIVKTTLTPMLYTLSILNYVDVDSESEMLGYGIGIILLNAGIYFVMPGIILSKIVTKYQKNVRRCAHC